MRQLLRVAATMTVVLALVPDARADWTLSLVPETVDPGQLSIGQSVRVDIVLSGLAPGDAVDYLAGTVTYEGSLLGTATNVSPGGIVPDAGGFVGAGFDGLVDAFYDAVFFSTTGTPITSDGVFYTFDVVAQRAGSGTFRFDPASLAATDGSNATVPLSAGPDLPYTITSAVPEPVLSVLATSGLLSCGGISLIRRFATRRIGRTR